jgi:O-antigen/teichoic acid export membrane protein
MSTAHSIKRLGSETIIYGISGTIGHFVSIFLIPLYTRVFSTADYGYISILTAGATLLSAFIILGLDSASGRWFFDGPSLARQRQIISSWFWCQTGVGLIVTALIIAFAPQISAWLIDSPAGAPLVILAALTVPLSTFSKVLGNWLRYRRMAWPTMIFFTASSLITIGLVVWFVLVLHRGVAGLFWGRTLAATLASVVAVVWLRGWIKPVDISKPLLREMLIYGLPLVPAAMAAWVTASADRFILKGFVPASEIGIYSIGVSVASAIALVTSGFTLAWGPFAFSIMNKPGADRVYAKVWSLYSLLGCLLATMLSLFTPLVLRLFTTPEYYSAASTVPWLSFGYVAMGATYIVALGCSIVKKSQPIAVSIFIGAGVNTLLNFLLIPRLGKDGAAVATGIAYSAVVVYLYVISQRNYPIPYRMADAVICLGVSAALIVANRWLLPPDALWAYAARIGMCLLFVPLAFVLKIVHPDHVRMAVRYTRRHFHWPLKAA